MRKDMPLVGFAREWAQYIEERGHRVSKLANRTYVLLSRNGHGARFRWLILRSDADVRRLTAIEHEIIQKDLARRGRGKEQGYVVVRFERPAARVLVLPADRALMMGSVRSDRGGIPWEP